VGGPLGVRHGGELVHAHAEGLEAAGLLVVVLLDRRDGGVEDALALRHLVRAVADPVSASPRVEVQHLRIEGGGERGRMAGELIRARRG
jgi:hypothetical protein